MGYDHDFKVSVLLSFGVMIVGNLAIRELSSQSPEPIKSAQHSSQTYTRYLLCSELILSKQVCCFYSSLTQSVVNSSFMVLDMIETIH